MSATVRPFGGVDWRAEIKSRRNRPILGFALAALAYARKNDEDITDKWLADQQRRADNLARLLRRTRSAIANLIA
jgi:hypothetical protein